MLASSKYIRAQTSRRSTITGECETMQLIRQAIRHGRLKGPMRGADLNKVHATSRNGTFGSFRETARLKPENVYPCKSSIKLNALRRVLDTFSVLLAQGILSDIALFVVPSRLLVLSIGFGNRQLKCVAMVTLNFFDSRSA
jgi:hypothetical protein